MGERRQRRWRADVEPQPISADFSWRHPKPADAPSLGQLMLEAYRGTIDEQDETLAAAIGHVQRFFAGEFGDPLLDSSFVAPEEDEPRSVTLVSLFEGEPLLAQVYTSPAWVNRGFATRLIQMSMNGLADAGFQFLNLFVTEGNQAAEHLYDKLGFEPFDAPD